MTGINILYKEGELPKGTDKWELEKLDNRIKAKTIKTMENKLGQEPAFPCLEFNESGNGNCITLTIAGEKQYIPFKEGVSKRFYAACFAMQGILSNSKIAESLQEYKIPGDVQLKEIIKSSYMYADELLRQENEKE